MARVLIKNLVKRFGSTLAVNNLNLEIKDKEFVVLLGPSGCGKTTTLRCIAGLETPDSGEIYIGDTLVNDLPPKDRDIAMVFQSYALYPHMTVYDNIAFPLKIRKLPKSEIDKKVKEVAKLLQISELLDRKPKQLSGGQAQRVALGRSIVREPKVWLMDEPLSNLDAKLRLYMRAELKRLQKELAITTVYVTHDQAEAMTMGDRIAVMNKGLLQQYASPDEVFNRPANVFVAGFIGSPPTNMAPGTFVERDGKGYFDGGAIRFRLPDAAVEAIKAKGANEIIFGIRPRDLVVSDKKPETEMYLTAELYISEPLGDEMVLDLKMDDQIFKAVVMSYVGEKFDIGQKLYLTFDPSKLHVFDKKTEELIY
ncbi:MAG: ABC transporter ATP-binding protein [Nitrososphaeria archaeon]